MSSLRAASGTLLALSHGCQLPSVGYCVLFPTVVHAVSSFYTHSRFCLTKMILQLLANAFREGSFTTLAHSIGLIRRTTDFHDGTTVVHFCLFAVSALTINVLPSIRPR